MFDLAVCQRVVGGRDGLDDLRLAAAAGFTAIALDTARLGSHPARRWCDELARLGLRVTGVTGIRGILDEPIDVEGTLHLAHAVGAHHVTVTTGPRGDRSPGRADDACRAWFARFQPLAAELGLRLALEPLHPLIADKSHVHTLRHALDLVAEAPGAGVVVDTGHLWSDPGLAEALGDAGEAIVAVQVSDVPAAAVAGAAYDRVPLGAGTVPNQLLVGDLVQGGFAGPFELETLCPGADRAAELAGQRRALAALVRSAGPGRSHRHLEIDGLRFHVVVQGDGPLVVMAHGFPGLWYSWRHQLDALAAAGYRAVAFDQRGIGGTEAPAGEDGWGHERAIADLLGIAAALGEDRAVYVGHDVGGPQVWELAAQHPERVRGVAVLSTPYEPHRSPVRPTEAYAAVAERHFLHKHYFQEVGRAERELDADVEAFLRRLFHALSADGRYRDVWAHPSEGTGYLDALPPVGAPLPWLDDDDLAVYVAEYTRTGFAGGLGWYRAADRDWERRGRRADATITVPALFVAGTEDPVPRMAAPGVLDRMRAAVPQLHDVVEVPGAGHWVQQERPDPVNRAIIEFLRTLP